jgi:hypothetical protein
MTTIHTPGRESDPSSGVQCIHRGLPSTAGAGETLFAVEVETEGTCVFARLGDDCVSQDILAVTPMPCDRASNTPSRTCCGPPTRSMRCDCESPGIRSEGEVKIIRREGYGRTRRYYRLSANGSCLESLYMQSSNSHSDIPPAVFPMTRIEEMTDLAPLYLRTFVVDAVFVSVH